MASDEGYRKIAATIDIAAAAAATPVHGSSTGIGAAAAAAAAATAAAEGSLLSDAVGRLLFGFPSNPVPLFSH